MFSKQKCLWNYNWFNVKSLLTGLI